MAGALPGVPVPVVTLALPIVSFGRYDRAWLFSN
jgi:hypothetical protein